jgi:hypothetical protein
MKRTLSLAPPPPFPFPELWDRVREIQNETGENYWFVPPPTTTNTLIALSSQIDTTVVDACIPVSTNDVMKPKAHDEMVATTAVPESNMNNTDCLHEDAEPTGEYYEELEANPAWVERFAATIDRLNNRNKRQKKRR